MTLVKFNQRPGERKMNPFFDDLFNDLPAKFFSDNIAVPHHSVPVNIKESEKAYLLEVIAPGMEKQDFKVNIDANELTISGEKKADSAGDNQRQVRREFTFKSFKRTFTLDEKIDAEKIMAKYENGVLHIELPKKEEARIQPKAINVL